MTPHAVTGIIFREAVPGDEAKVAWFVRALADYEKLLHECVATEADFAEVASRNRRNALTNPKAQVAKDVPVEVLLEDPYVVAPLRRHALPPLSDSAAAVVLAAGAGTRMRSARPKPLHRLCGRPMILHVIDALAELDVERVVVVVGHGAEQVVKSVEELKPAGLEVEFVEQAVQRVLGTKVSLRRSTKGVGSLTIHFYSDEELEGVLDRLGVGEM